MPLRALPAPNRGVGTQPPCRLWDGPQALSALALSVRQLPFFGYKGISWTALIKNTVWIHIYFDRRLGGETNREIDFGFGSVVRARGLVVRWE